MRDASEEKRHVGQDHCAHGVDDFEWEPDAVLDAPVLKLNDIKTRVYRTARSGDPGLQEALHACPRELLWLREDEKLDGPRPDDIFRISDRGRACAHVE